MTGMHVTGVHAIGVYDRGHVTGLYDREHLEVCDKGGRNRAAGEPSKSTEGTAGEHRDSGGVPSLPCG